MPNSRGLTLETLSTFCFYLVYVYDVIKRYIQGEGNQGTQRKTQLPQVTDKLYHINMYWVHLAMRRIRPHKLSAQQIIKASSCHQIHLYILLRFKE